MIFERQFFTLHMAMLAMITYGNFKYVYARDALNLRGTKKSFSI